MKVISASGNINLKRASCVTIGVFDGVHRGHKILIKRTVSFAKKNKLVSIVVTFDPHPELIIKRKKRQLLLISLNHRLSLISKLGVDICVILKFNKYFNHLKAEDFVNKILVNKLNMRHIFIGNNFLFGYKRAGSIELLKELAKKFGFKVHVQNLEKNKGNPISSTLLRRLIQRGYLKEAERLLDRKVEVVGRVIGGDHKGKKLGFPTANLSPDHEIIPPRGVYLIEAWLGKKRLVGLANIGICPTLKKIKKEIIEVHLLNFKKNIYGKELRIIFLGKLRDEKKFSKPSLLINQIKTDVRKAKEFFHF